VTVPHDSSSPITARRVVVHGRVQGVFFRDSCQREAVHAGVTGWVRNAADGSVQAHFEGPAEGVQAMIDWVHRGPRHADVSRVEVTEAEPTGASSFEVVG
jgi:acylphosphatase